MSKLETGGFAKPQNQCGRGEGSPPPFMVVPFASVR